MVRQYSSDLAGSQHILGPGYSKQFHSPALPAVGNNRAQELAEGDRRISIRSVALAEGRTTSSKRYGKGYATCCGGLRLIVAQQQQNVLAQQEWPGLGWHGRALGLPWSLRVKRG
ncbi:hypothetical protein VaNZ11_002761 [Volvox africanus]|uniref:Uncharacterized protein n=1 Tax=Volvox africanus TaxID=51714 RepID=A0ABQ5RTP4_9CHLO|nr:hypothetical protein VaNZ11_002761 [Volvox africanus]